MKKERRIPRPQGTTALVSRLRTKEDTHIKDKTIKHILKQYVLNNCTLNKEEIGIDGLSRYLGINEERCMVYFTRVNKELGVLLGPKYASDMARVMILIGIKGQQQAQRLILQQVQDLLRSQKGKYKPFISKEVNTALGLLTKNNEGALNIAKLLQGPTPISLNQNTTITNNQTNIHNNSLTVNRAVEILEDKLGNLALPEAREALYRSYSDEFGTLPDVDARTQNPGDDYGKGMKPKDIKTITINDLEE